jgi:hypothetical protein
VIDKFGGDARIDQILADQLAIGLVLSLRRFGWRRGRRFSR